jgi:hypothetical protein
MAVVGVMLVVFTATQPMATATGPIGTCMLTTRVTDTIGIGITK